MEMEIHRVPEFVPSGLRHLQQEPYVVHVIGGDLSVKPYSFVVSEAPAVDGDMDTPQDEELFVMDSSVIWSIGGVVQKSFTVSSPQRTEKVRAAVWTHMDFEEEGHGAKVPRRTLVVLYTTFAKFHLDNGQTFVSNVPFVTSQVWALDRGILLSRQLEHGETADTSVPYLFTWTHPLEEIKWIPASGPQQCLSPKQDNHGKSKEKSTTSFLPIDESVLCVHRAHKSGKTIILTLCNATGTFNVWDYETLGSSGKKLERSYSAYRQSPLNGDSRLALVARALGDTKSKIGLKWIASGFLEDSNVLKAFITEHEDDVMIWTQSSLMLCGWLLVKSSDSVKLTRQFKEASISAIGMLSTNAQEKDVLFLSPQHRLTLWSRRFGLVNIKLADNFLPNADASTTVLKRRRSSLGASSLPSSGFVSPSRGSRLVQLRDSASNRVTLCLSNNALFRVTIDLRPKSSLGKRCFLALKDSIGLDKEKAIANRFWNLRHSKDSRLDSLRQNGEFLDFSVTLLSFYGWTATIPEETPTSSPWEAMNNAAQRLGLFEKLPDCVIQALDINKETKSNTGIRQMLSVAKKLRDTLMNPVEFVIEDWCLLSTVFHEVYESLKLSILSQSAARELGELLCILACVTGRKQYSTYYRFDGLVHDAFIPDCKHIDNVSVPLNILSWVKQTVKYERCPENPQLEARDPDSIKEVHRIVLFYETLYSKGPRALIKKMVSVKYRYEDLQLLPVGVSLPLLEAIYACKFDPPGEWPFEAYCLIGREDLAELLTKKKTSSRLHKAAEREIAPPPDINSIIDSVNQSKKSTTIKEKEIHEKTKSISKLRFNSDDRLSRVGECLSFSKCRSMEFNLAHDTSDADVGVLQQKQLRWLSNRTLALPLGQAIFTYQTIKPSQAEKFDIRELNLSARIPPTNSIVELDTAQILPMKNWSEFHSGVASGLSVFDDTNFVDSSWISFNQTLSQESTVVFDNKHAGFLLGLGLNGHLKSLQAFDFYDYLIAKDDITSIGLSLGLAASYTRTMDPQITKLLSIHVQGMLPPGSALLNISALTQTVSVLGLGLVYMGTLNRKMAECMLKELLRDFKSQKDSTFESCSHAYTVAAGFSLGMIILGQVKQGAGLADMQITTKLLNVIQKNDFSCPLHGATIALSIIYIKTNQSRVSEKLAIPDTMHELDRIPPDLVLLRVIARNMIHWDDMEASTEWVEKQIPAILRESGNQTLSVIPMYYSVLSGVCFSLGLRFAGSANNAAFTTLLAFYENISRNLTKGGSYEAKLLQTQHRACLDVLMISLSMVMAGTGNLKIFNILENQHNQVSKDVTYGNHASCHLAMGLLFLGNGAYTLGTSPQAIAALLCAFYPRFPSSADDNRFHNQAFRHLWVLAVETRCLVTRDVKSREICSVPVTITIGDSNSSEGLYSYADFTPCLLPPFEQINTIKFESPRYWPFQLDVATNPVHHSVMTTNAEILVKKKAGHHSYTVDPQGRRGLVASSFPKYLFSACDARTLKSREAFIKSVSASPPLVAFAEHFCKPENDGSTSSSFTSFCTNVLYECLKDDKPDVLRAYLWLYDTTKNLDALDCQSMRNLKIISALFDKTKTLNAEMKAPFFEPCLIQHDYLDIIKTKINNYFRIVEKQEDSRLGWMLNHFASQGESFLGVTKADFVRLGCYLSFFEWPYSFDDLKSRIAEHSGTNPMELAIHLRPSFKDVPLSTLLDIVKRSVSQR